ncbi:hypothetical protein QCA50_002099 [Cerrena zonata]|uniref:Uncharacterized protein n=1 Tax=Cerrena zonata TaxID=2478898 RepID=A0AAW0GN53_9APHY
MHTFCVIVLQWKPNPKPIIAITVLSGIWLFVTLIVTIGYGVHRGETYYGDTQYCEQLAETTLGYTMLIDCQGAGSLRNFRLNESPWSISGCGPAAFLNIVLYIPIALVLKGVLAVQGGRLRLLNHGGSRKHLSQMLNFHVAANRIAVKMLFYPAVYTCTVLPIAIVRWRAFTGHCVPWEATVVADVLFASSGLMNVLLFMFTRPNLMPQREGSTSLPRVDTNFQNLTLTPLSIYPPSSTYAPAPSRRSEVSKYTNIPFSLHKDSLSPPASTITLEPWRNRTTNMLYTPNTRF